MNGHLHHALMNQLQIFMWSLLENQKYGGLSFWSKRTKEIDEALKGLDR